MNKVEDNTPIEDLILAFRRKILKEMVGIGHELTVAQSEVLRLVGRRGASAMKDVASGLSISPPSATAFIEEMEKKGLVQRVRDKTDRRAVFIRLTPKSRAVFKKVSGRKKAIANEMLSRISSKDKSELGRIISKILSK